VHILLYVTTENSGQTCALTQQGRLGVVLAQDAEQGAIK